MQRVQLFVYFPVRVTSHIIDLVTRQFGLRIVIYFDQVVKNNLKAEAFKSYFHYILLYGSSSPRGPKFSGPNVYGSSFVLCKFSKTTCWGNWRKNGGGGGILGKFYGWLIYIYFFLILWVIEFYLNLMLLVMPKKSNLFLWVVVGGSYIFLGTALSLMVLNGM